MQDREPIHFQEEANSRKIAVEDQQRPLLVQVLFYLLSHHSVPEAPGYLEMLSRFRNSDLLEPVTARLEVHFYLHRFGLKNGNWNCICKKK